MLCIMECGAGKCSRIDNGMSIALFFSTRSPALVPPGGVAVCPLSTVQYTCVADNQHPSFIISYPCTISIYSML